MAKNYKETTTQAAVLRTSTKTLSFWCNIREAPLERFAELIEGNIRIALQDFSGGKGDKSKFAYFNLEISDIYEIKDCMQAKKSFFAQKIYGKHPETGGQFNGMCKSFHFALQYTEKAQNGELSRNPYYLCIKNGFAQAAPGQIAGSFYERKGTFQEGVAVFIRLSERDLKNLLRKVTDYIRVFQMLAGQHLIPLGLAQMENEYSQRKNGYNYNDSYTNPTDYYSPDYYNQNGQGNPSQQSYGSVGQREMPAQNTPPSMQPQGYGQAPNSNSANLQQTNVRVYKKTVTVLTFPVATTEGYVAKILMDTKQWVCFFDQNTAEIVSQACNSGKTQIKMRVTPYRGGAKCLEIIE